MKKPMSWLVVALLLGNVAPPAAGQRPATLKDAYRDAFRMGAAVNDAIVAGRDTASARVVVQQFNTITVENAMKAGPINPRPGEFNWGPADSFVEFGERNGMFIVGHTLVWHNQTPDWFFQDSTGKPNTPAAQIERMRRHIEAVAGRYAGRVHAWDVVNEVIAEDGSYRPTTWVNSVGSGDELVKNAFRFASRYAPGTELYYNEFNAWRPAKRDGIVRMVRMLQREGIRIDGIGMQGHWGLNYPKTEYIEAAIDSFAALGVKVMITELDVDVLPISREGQVIGAALRDPQFQLEEFEEYLDPYRAGLPDSVQRQLADRYAEIFRIFLRKRDKIDRVTLWGVHDGMSWKNGSPVPGRTNYPLLFDRSRRPKPAFDAVLALPSSPSATDTVRPDPRLVTPYGADACPSCAGWNVPRRPFRLHGGTYYVGTEGLSALLITSPQGHVLVDAGLPDSAPLILDNIRALGFDARDIRLIVNSHAHYDHAGGVAAIQRVSGARVAGSPWSAPVMATGRSAPGDPQLGIALDYPAAGRVERFAFGDTLRVGPIALVPHATGGHTPGGTTWSWRSCDAQGCVDLVYADSQTPVSADGFRFTGSPAVAQYERGLALLERLPCDLLVTPHPSASSLWQRLDAGRQALLDPTACRRYAAGAREQLARRLQQEAGAAQ